MAYTLKLEIVTPEAMVFSDDVEMVSLSGIDGDMGIYPDHMPLMTQLVAGEVLVRKAGADIALAVGDGFVQVTKERVAILTDMAIKSDDIDEQKAIEAQKKAEARLAQKLSDEEAATVQAALMHAAAQIKVKQRHKK
jgi:F-type H+-transporting ATPase subunit epsilon